MTDRIWKTDCARCRHACSQTVHIGDCAYGNDVEEYGCDVEDRLRDEDNELIDEGRCPLWCPNLERLKDLMVCGIYSDDDDEDLLESVCSYLDINMAEVRKEAARKRRIKKVGDMYRDPDYHDIMVEMVQSEGEEW